MISFVPSSTALILIDLQNGIVGRPAAPRTGAETAATGIAIAAKFRAARAPVILVNVSFAADYADAPPQAVDQAIPRQPGGLPAGYSDLVEGLAQPGDIRITKRHWGAFYGTELDLQLRRRGVRTIVLAGIATNFGVESTARQAWEFGYDVVVAEDACTTTTAELHDMAIRFIFPRIARVSRSSDIALAAAA